jgi:hypothetical protein
VINRAAELVALGLPMASIAQACGVHRATLATWVSAGLQPGAKGLERDLADAIQAARAEGEEHLIRRLHKLAEHPEHGVRASTWLLSHSPRWRDQWSEAAHARREVQKVVAMFVAALEEEPSLRAEQRERILLRVRAKGLALAAGDGSEQE